MNHCKDCCFWDGDVCDKVDFAYQDFRRTTKVPVDGFIVGATVSDDSGLITNLRTGPEFGCVQFQPKER